MNVNPGRKHGISNALTLDDQLYCNPELAQFYDLENGYGPDFDYCAQLARDASSVLDLGCGTGMFLSSLPGDRYLVGVDPAAAMLEIATRRPGGAKVTWIEADARMVRLDDKFDLIVLTGHAFQVFLNEPDQRSVLATIAAHLTPSGRFIFDSRNPGKESWRSWTPAETMRNFEHPKLGTIEAWSDVSQNDETGVVTYDSYYRIRSEGRQLSAHSDIYFVAKPVLDNMIKDAGLIVDGWLGDWHGTPWHRASHDIIPIGRLAGQDHA